MTADHVRLARILLDTDGHRMRLRQVARVLAFASTLAREADRTRFLVMAAGQTVSSFALGAGVLITRDVLHKGLSPGNGGMRLSAVAVGLTALVALGAVTSLTGLVLAMQQQVLQAKTTALACERVAEAVSATDLRTFEDPRFHDRVEQAVWAAREHVAALATIAFTLLSAVLKTAAVTVAVMTLAWWLLPVLVLAAVPPVRMALRRHRGDFALRLELMENRRSLSYYLQVLTGRDTAKEVRAFDLSPVLRARMRAGYAEAIEAERYLQRLFLWRQVRARLLGDLILVGAVAFIVVMIDLGRLSLAIGITVLGAAYLLFGQLRSLVGLSGLMGGSTLFVEALRGFIETAPSRRTEEPVPEPFKTLRAEHIHFTYPAAQTPALDEVSIELVAGQVVALVGENGSGKTTLAKVLTGLYTPDTGRLLWDGEPVTPQRLRAGCAVLFQDFAHYKLTGSDNIGLGRPARIDDARAVAQAAARAGAHEFLDRLPRSYGTVLSSEFTGGVDLSTGQWQRVALARAYFRDAPFIVLDEPTAALDPRAEAKLFSTMKRLYAGRTVLLITHRFSSVRHADRIYVLAGGRVVEQGDHTELMAMDGVYAELFLTQAAGFADLPPTPASRTAHEQLT